LDLATTTVPWQQPFEKNGYGFADHRQWNLIVLEQFDAIWWHLGRPSNYVRRRDPFFPIDLPTSQHLWNGWFYFFVSWAYQEFQKAQIAVVLVRQHWLPGPRWQRMPIVGL